MYIHTLYPENCTLTYLSEWVARIAFTPIQQGGVPLKRILVLTPHLDNVWAEELIDGFFAQLLAQTDKKAFLEVIIVSFDNKISTAYDRARMYLDPGHEPFDCIVTIGHVAAVAVSVVARVVNCLTPRLTIGVDEFFAINNPQAQFQAGVLRKESTSSKPAEFFAAVRPDVSHMIFPIDEAGDSAMTLTLMEQLEQLGVSTYEVVVDSVQSLQNVVAKLDASTALCVTPEAYVANAHFKKVVSSCNTRGVTLFSSSATNVRLGAAIGYGHNGLMYGVQTGKLLHELLYSDTPVGSLVSPLITDSTQLCYNPSNLSKQRVNMDNFSSFRQVAVAVGG